MLAFFLFCTATRSTKLRSNKAIGEICRHVRYLRQPINGFNRINKLVLHFPNLFVASFGARIKGDTFRHDLDGETKSSDTIVNALSFPMSIPERKFTKERRVNKTTTKKQSGEIGSAHAGR